MAKNLCQSLPSSDTLLIHDANAETMRRFLAEPILCAVREAGSPRALAETSVGNICFSKRVTMQCLYRRDILV